MTTYVVCGDSIVAGKKYSEKLTDEDLEGANIDALISGGHIKPAKTSAATPQTQEGEK